MSGYIDHVVLCGYEPGAEMLLQAILTEIDSEAKPLVVFAEGDRPAECPPEFAWVSGDPTKESELDKVRLSHASAAIVVGSRVDLPQDADAKTLLTLFTVRSYMRRRARSEARHQPLYLVAEILDSENVEHAYTAGADEVIETRRLGFSLLAHAVSMPGTAALMSDVATTGEHSLFIGALPEDDWAGMTFDRLADRLKEEKNILVIGIRDSRRRDRINPPDDLVVEAGSQVVYLAKKAALPPGDGRRPRAASRP